MPFTEVELAAARNAWGAGLVTISRTYETQGLDKARDVANDILDAAYGYEFGPVLFKPTLSGGEKTFRTTRKGALSYFVGHDPDYPCDTGFALRGWERTHSETAAFFIEGDIAMWMGWMTFTDKDGQSVRADKSFGYRKDPDGAPRIVLHHSSLPYQG